MKNLLPLLILFFFACNQGNQLTPNSQLASICDFVKYTKSNICSVFEKIMDVNAL